MVCNVVIDPEFESLIPPLAEDELLGLEESILKDGCRKSLDVWEWEGKAILIDGHNRYRICKRHNKPFEIDPVSGLLTRDDVVEWIIRNQFDRRNINPWTRGRLALRLKEVYAKKAKENEIIRKGKQAGATCQNSDKLIPIDTKREIAKVANLSHDTIHRIEVIEREATEDVKKKLDSGEISVNEAYRDVRRPLIKESIAHVAYNSGENEWYTPKNIIALAVKVMGGIDLDPASSVIANMTVGSKKYYTKKEDGLIQPWAGRVWMNPPYAQPLIEKFCLRLVEHYERGDVTEACVLVNNATETKWFQCMFPSCSAVCFIRSRVRFVDKDGSPSGAPLQGQAVLYFGDNIDAFKKTFLEMGIVLS